MKITNTQNITEHIHKYHNTLLFFVLYLEWLKGVIPIEMALYIKGTKINTKTGYPTVHCTLYSVHPMLYEVMKTISRVIELERNLSL